MVLEIAATLAAAEAAVKGIKRAINVGKDAKDCLHEFMSLFDAQDKLQKASTDERAKKPNQSAMSEALESVIAARKVRQMTEELREFLVWSGQADVWDDILKEHNMIIQRRKAAELAEQRENERALRRRKELGLVLVVVGTGILLLYHIVNYIIDKWASLYA